MNFSTNDKMTTPNGYYNTAMQCLKSVVGHQKVDVIITEEFLPKRNAVYRAVVGAVVQSGDYRIAECTASSKNAAKQSAAALFLENFYPTRSDLKKPVCF